MFEIRRVGWRKWLGASRADAWTALAGQLDAKFDEGGWVKSDSVVLTVGADGSWRVVLDMYMVTVGRVSIPFTRLRVPFLNPSGFRFSVQKADFFTPVMTQLGAQDVSVGVPAFNESVVVKSSDAARAAEFFSGRRTSTVDRRCRRRQTGSRGLWRRVGLEVPAAGGCAAVRRRGRRARPRQVAPAVPVVSRGFGPTGRDWRCRGG